jgi:hypothetical protein
MSASPLTHPVFASLDHPLFAFGGKRELLRIFFWQTYCNHPITMMNNNNNFQNIFDAYQLISGAKIKGKKQDEIFELGEYDANKRGYTVYPIDNGVRYDDFAVVVAEKELKNNFVIEVVKVNTALAA